MSQRLQLVAQKDVAAAADGAKQLSQRRQRRRERKMALISELLAAHAAHAAQSILALRASIWHVARSSGWTRGTGDDVAAAPSSGMAMSRRLLHLGC